MVGDWHSELHEEAVYQSFVKLGHDVDRFSWHQYFHAPSKDCFSAVVGLLNRFQNKYLFGPLLNKINADVLRCVDEVRPEFVFFYRATHIYSSALRKIRTNFPSIILVGYNNDDPFAQGHSRWLWRHFLSGIPLYDLVLAYRHHNLADFKEAGAHRVELLRSWFIPERNHPVVLDEADRERFDCDVVFAGHYEDDGRIACLEAIVESGFKLRLFGPGKYWDPVLRRSKVLRHLAPVQMVWGDDYNKALCGAKVALCFFSRLNRDTYTRRCFEIPATRTLLLSEYSDEVSTLYRAGEEADFFKSKEELVAKVRYYVDNESLRASVAEAGYHRVQADGHDVVSRMKQVLRWVEQFKESKGSNIDGNV